MSEGPYVADSGDAIYSDTKINKSSKSISTITILSGRNSIDIKLQSTHPYYSRNLVGADPKLCPRRNFSVDLLYYLRTRAISNSRAELANNCVADSLCLRYYNLALLLLSIDSVHNLESESSLLN